MTTLISAPVFVAMDSDGDYAIGTDADEAIQNYNDNVGGTLPLRVVEVTVKMAPPVITSIEVEVPNEAGQEIAAQAE